MSSKSKPEGTHTPPFDKSMPPFDESMPPFDESMPPFDESMPPFDESTDDTAALLLALKFAHSPNALSTERHEALLTQALGLALTEPNADDVFAQPTPDELEQSTLLALAIDGQATHPLAELATALRQAHAPEPLSQLGLERAQRTMAAPGTHRGRNEKSPKVHAWIRPTTGAGVALALAATFALVWLPRQHHESTDSAQQKASFVASRSLAPLFAEESSLGTSTERMDRIVMARSRDLRHNRYLTWRVR